MKSKIISDEHKYPKLMRSEYSDNVYLITSEGSGMCVYDHSMGDDLSTWDLGQFSESLAMDMLVEFDGTVELKN